MHDWQPRTTSDTQDVTQALDWGRKFSMLLCTGHHLMLEPEDDPNPQELLCQQTVAQVVCLESYMRLRAQGVLANLQRPEAAWDRVHPHKNGHLVLEVDALLKVDRHILHALAALTQPHAMTYRHALPPPLLYQSI